MSGQTWRDRLAERPPLADHWRSRHHCTDVVLGESSVVDKTCYTSPQEQDSSTTKGKALKLIRTAAVLGAVLAIALAGSASAYPGGSDGNHAENWENQFDVPATCVKYEPFDQSAPVDLWVGTDGVVLSPGDYVALILKSALVNDVFVDPTPGNLYLTASNKDISHIIVCTPKEVEPSATPSVEPSVEPSPTPSAEPSVEPTPLPSPSTSPSETPAPSSTPSSPTPTPTTSSSVPPVVTVTAPPTDTEPTTTPSAPSNGTLFLLAAIGTAAYLLVWKFKRPYGRR